MSTFTSNATPVKLANHTPMIILAFAVLMLLIVGSMDSSDQEAAQLSYCNNVKEFKATNGKSGHPDFKGIYRTSCN